MSLKRLPEEKEKRIKKKPKVYHIPEAQKKRMREAVEAAVVAESNRPIILSIIAEEDYMNQRFAFYPSDKEMGEKVLVLLESLLHTNMANHVNLLCALTNEFDQATCNEQLIKYLGDAKMPGVFKLVVKNKEEECPLDAITLDNLDTFLYYQQCFGYY